MCSVLNVILSLLLISLLFSCSTNVKNSSADASSREAVLQVLTPQENPALKEAWKLPTYFFLVDRFYDGTKKNNEFVKKGVVLSYQGGDLEGVNKKIDYFTKLNIGTLLTTPLTSNRKTDQSGHWGAHGYWIIDHFKMDDHWGTEEDLKKFTELRQKNNQKFLLDLVLNHVDATHPWVKDHPDWFHTYGPMKNDQDDKERTEGEIYGLPDLKQENPEVYKVLVEYTKHWMNLTLADGLRFDSVRHIDHSFWKRYLPEIKKYAEEKYGKKEFLLLGEVLHGDPQVFLPYMQDGFNSFYDYPLYYSLTDVFAKHQSMLKLPARLQEMDRLFGEKILWTTFIDNHDTPRFFSADKKADSEDLKQAIAFITAIRGMPLIYSGDEDRIRGKNGEEGRKMITFSHQKDFDDIARINKLRAEFPSLSQGLHEDLRATDTHYVFRRITPSEETLVIINRAEAPGTLALNLEEDSLFANEKQIADKLNRYRVFNIKDKKLTLFLRKRDVIVLSLKGEAKRFKILQERKVSLKPVKIFIDAENLEEGEQLFVVGAGTHLGAWDPQKALGPFEAVLGNKYGAEFELPQGAVLEYKFIKKNSQGKVTWEGGDNHYVFLDSATHQIRRTWSNH